MHVKLLAIFFFVLATFANGQVEGSGADDPVRFGDENASFTIEVFVDFQCPSCSATYPGLKEFGLKHADRVAIIFRHLPLNIHDKSMIAAQAVEAARKQGKAVQMIDMILKNQQLWAYSPKTKTFSSYARS